MVEPRSEEVSTYVAAVAPTIAVPPRFHWRKLFVTGAPAVPLRAPAVSVLPTVTVPVVAATEVVPGMVPALRLMFWLVVKVPVKVKVTVVPPAASVKVTPE